MTFEKNAVEVWAKNVASAPLRVLTPKETSDFVKCYKNKDDLDKNPELLKLLEDKESFMSAFWLRVKHCHTYKVTPSLCLYLSTFIKNFGISTMLANYLQYIAYKHKRRVIDFDVWSHYAFPWGVPTDEGWKNLWDLQKIPHNPDNLLDIPQCMESIKHIM